MPILDYLTCRMSIYRNVVWFTKGNFLIAELKVKKMNNSKFWDLLLKVCQNIQNQVMRLPKNTSIQLTWKLICHHVP